MKLTTQLFSTLFVLLTILPLRVDAHPHSWITLKTEFMLDEKGRLTELQQHWEFDVYFSMMTLADIMNENEDQKKGLEQLAKDMVNNLRSYDYFSELKIDNQPVALTKPSDYSLTTAFKEGQQQLTLNMRFKLTDTRPIERKTLSWRVFDPTYYIDMRHHKTSQVLIHKKNATECSTSIELPEPSDEMIDYASSLDRSKKDTEGLGAYFAEKVLIHCL